VANSLYHEETWRYTDEAISLSNRASILLRPLIEEFIEKGYSPREIAHVIEGAVVELELDAVLDKG
jgi:hypothetical protein